MINTKEFKVASIIIPVSGNKDAVKKLKKKTDDGDELFFFHATSNNIESLLNKTITDSNSDEIILVSPIDQYIEKKDKNFIKLLKEYNGVVISNFVEGRNEITNKTSIKFNKNNWEPVEKNSKNLKDYINNIGISLDKDDVVKINTKQETKDLEEQESDTIVNVTMNSKKLKKAKKKGIDKRKRSRPNTPNVKYRDPVKRDNELPNVLILVDVKGWAWWIKSQYIKKYLEPYYNIDVNPALGGGNKAHKSHYQKYDLCFTYGHFFIKKLRNIPKEKRITGVTAHRPIGVIKSAMQLAKYTHANSVLLYKELKQIHKNPFYTPNGVDTDIFYEKKPLLNINKVIFGHVGKQSPMKGQLDFIEPAIKKVDVEYFSHYNNHKTKIPHRNMIDVHQNYDVFVCASKEDGTPCPGLEAAACGRPIISNKIGNMPELVKTGETGILLDKKKVDLYVDAIKWCRDNPDKVLEMGKNIRKKIEEEWTWELMAKNYLYLFDTALKIKRDPEIYKNPARHHVK